MLKFKVRSVKWKYEITWDIPYLVKGSKLYISTATRVLDHLFFMEITYLAIL